MEEGATNQEAHEDEIRAPPLSEPEAGSQPNVEATINPKALEDAVQNALKNYLPRLESAGSGARAEFYNKFKREADEYDNDFLEKYRGDLDTTLIFAGLFSAVASAFIVAIQTRLQPDYTQLSYDILWMTANSTGLSPPPKPSSDSPWTGPDPTLVRVQAILFSSLAASLLAAFVAMLGKQWLNRYSQVEVRGPLMDRSRNRQRKMNGMATWGFKFVMESLPLMLQAALLLLGCALSKYLFTIDNLVAWVVFGFTASGLLFYLTIVVAATMSYDCPFQTPLSQFIRFMTLLFNERGKHLEKSKRWLSRRLFWKRRWWKRRIGGSNGFAGLGWFGGDDNNEYVELHRIDLPHRPLPAVLFDHIDREGYLLDSNCVAWMFEMSTDPDAILDIMKFIPEIIWHDGIHATPLEKLYDTVLECFDHSSHRPVLIPKFKNKAYLSAKALLHLSTQRKCIGNAPDMAVFGYISRRHQTVGPMDSPEDPDLHYTLCMLDRVFGHRDFEPMDSEGFPFTSPHLAWMGRILPYRAWYFIKNNKTLPRDISEFLRRSFQQETPPTPIMLSCLLIIGLTFGIGSDYDCDQPIIDVDDGQKLRSRINRVYPMLVKVFRNSEESTAIPMNCAFGVLEFAIPLLDDKNAMESYKLFCVIMQDTVSSTLTQGQKWEASRLALHGAYKWGMLLPPVKDPQPVLDFLCHHFELVERGEDHDEPIQNALRALVYAPTPETIETLKNFDPTRPSFVHGICHVFQERKSLQLREAALFFLALIADKWFNSPDPIMIPNEMKILCADWASAVDEVGHSAPAVQKADLAVLLEMMNSPHWRPHIVPEKWRLLEYEYFASVIPDDSQALRRCLNNAELVQDISNMGNQDAMSLWYAILWLKYSELKPEVQRQLEGVMKGARRWDLERYLSVIGAEANKAEKELTGFNMWSTDPRAAILRTKIGNLKEPRDSLMAVRRGWR